MFVCFIAIYAVLTAMFIHKPQPIRRRFLLVTACLLPFFNLANEVWLCSVGHLGVRTELPLQLCGTMYILIPLMVIWRSWIILEFVYACGMPGAFLAMLTPNIQGYYFISWGYLMFFVIHSLIVYVPLFMLATGEFRPRIQHLPYAAGMFFGLVLVDFAVDRSLGSNYLYLRTAPKGTLLETFMTWAGSPGYLFLVLSVIIAIWLALYLPWEIYYRVQQRQPWAVD